MPDGTGVDATMQCLFCGEQEHVAVFEVIPGPAACPCCNGKLAKLGEDITESSAKTRIGCGTSQTKCIRRTD